MIIELPEKLSKMEKEGRVRIEDNILYLSKKESFVKTMIWLTYELKGSCCRYCGVELKKDEITWDHIYPQNFGGPTITNNLAASCFKCNNEKSNMTPEEYKNFIQVKQEGTNADIKRYIRKLLKKQEKLKKEGIFNLPKDWATILTVDDVNDSEYEVMYGKAYKKKEAYHKKYGHFEAPILVDRNGYLLDGCTKVLLAKNNGIKKIPAIILENVIIM